MAVVTQDSFANAIRAVGPYFGEVGIKCQEVISWLLNPENSGELSKKGHTFLFTHDENGKNAAIAFAKVLVDYGYSAVVSDYESILSSQDVFYALHIGPAVSRAKNQRIIWSFEEAATPSGSVAEKLPPRPHPSETLILPHEIRPKRALRGEGKNEIARLETQLEEQLAILRANAKPWKATGRSKIGQAYYLLTEVKKSLAENGHYLNRQGQEIDKETLFVKEGKKEGNIVRWEKAIRAVRDAYEKASTIMEELLRLGADVESEAQELNQLRSQLTEILAYQPTPIRVKNEEGGYNLYAAKTEKGRTSYEFYSVEEPAEARGVSSTDRERYVAMLWAQGLNDSSPVYGQAREILVDELTSEQLEQAIEGLSREKKDLTLIGPISDMLFDQMIGSGCVSKVVAAWVGNVTMG
ncbi:MAG: hypothetical protein ABIN58_01870, partial [candidate division WOR-3 bacterium]